MQDFYRLSIQMLLNAPFFGQLLLSLPKEEVEQSDSIQLAWLKSGQVGLQVGKAFSDSENGEVTLLHELTHLIFLHPLKIEGYPNKSIYSLAAELSVNEVLYETGQQDKIRPSDFGLPQQESTHFYYQELWRLQKEGKAPLEQLNTNQQQALAKHQNWLYPRHLATAKIQVQEQLHTAAKELSPTQWGELPKAIQEQLTKEISWHPPSQAWHRLLRLFCAQSRKTYLKSTLRRPSKRYPESQGLAIKRRQHLLLAIDTSGSIAAPLFERFFQEIHHIWKTGAQLEIVFCDTAIQEHMHYNGQMPQQIIGRGGTNFEAPIQLANAIRSTFDAIIYLTDGEGPTPNVRSTIPMLWLIAGSGGQYLEGQKLRL